MIFQVDFIDQYYFILMMCSQCAWTPLYDALQRGDSALVQYLIAVGADVGDVEDMYMVSECYNDKTFTNFLSFLYGAIFLLFERLLRKDGITRKIQELTTDDACRDIINHHDCAYETLKANPRALISAAVAHSAAISAPDKAVPETLLSLHEFFLMPSFSWTPAAAHNAVYAWARHAANVQLAVTAQPFSDLSDDCAGDILEFLEIEMTRAEALHIATHCSSPDARAWVRAIRSSVIVVSFSASIMYMQLFDNYCTSFSYILPILIYFEVSFDITSTV